MTAPIPEDQTEPLLDTEQHPPGEHGSDLTDGREPSAAAEEVQEENAETSFPEPSQ